MVNWEELKPVYCTTGQGYEVYQVSDCYVIPCRFYAMHYLQGNLKLKMSPEDMTMNRRVTTRFCGEFLRELALMANPKMKGEYPTLAVYDTKRRRWFAIEPKTSMFYLDMGVRQVKLPTADLYWEDKFFGPDGKALFDAKNELFYNKSYSEVCANGIPFSLTSLAPMWGETSAILGCV